MSRDSDLKPFDGTRQLQIDYARELNAQQFEAVTAPPGPSLVIAGAGSGKTRTLTYRVAYLLEQGVSPERILLLTFTNKAAREMMGRVNDLLGQSLQSLWGGTFHSIGNRILRRYADLLGYQRDFSILDRDDAKHLIAACLDEADIDIKARAFPKPEVLGELFSLAVNTQTDLLKVLRDHSDHCAGLANEIADVQQRYEERKRAIDAMDFDDLLVLWLRLLQEHETARTDLQRRFQFVLVDEYQDTNKLQSDLVDLLAARHRNLMVVGDDAQSIYAWRGANHLNILKFPERYPETRVFRIETNYRSTPEILHAANAAISANVHQFPKSLTPVRKPGVKPVVVPCVDARQQAQFIARRVLALMDEGVSLRQMAVLYRSHFHALELQLELDYHRVPYAITSGIRFFEQAHIKDTAAYLRLVINPRDELAFKRLVLMLPGIGAKAAAKLWAAFSAAGPATATRLDGAPPGAGLGPIAAHLRKCALLVPRKSQAPWAQLADTVAQLEAPGLRDDPARMLRLVLEAGYKDYLQDSYKNYRSRLEDVEQFAVHAAKYSSAEALLSELALLTSSESDEDAPAEGRKDNEALRLSTIHQAKGLEFDVVFLIMLCEGRFPNPRALEAPGGLEEERRLLYVAITRARNELYLTYPLWLVDFGGTGGVQSPSRFLREIPDELVEECSLLGYGSY